MNGVAAFIVFHFIQRSNFGANYPKLTEGRPVLSAIKWHF